MIVRGEVIGVGWRWLMVTSENTTDCCKVVIVISSHTLTVQERETDRQVGQGQLNSRQPATTSQT